MSMPSIHRIILYRLLAAWVVISLLIGATVSWLGIRKIDQQLVALASTELRRLAPADLALLKQPDAARSALDLLAVELVREHFIAVELQDLGRRKIAAAANPLHATMTLEAEREASAFPLDPQRNFRKFSTNAARTASACWAPAPAGQNARYTASRPAAQRRLFAPSRRAKGKCAIRSLLSAATRCVCACAHWMTWSIMSANSCVLTPPTLAPAAQLKRKLQFVRQVCGAVARACHFSASRQHMTHRKPITRPRSLTAAIAIAPVPPSVARARKRQLTKTNSWRGRPRSSAAGSIQSSAGCALAS